MKRIVYPAGALLIGLAASHALFTLLVHLSNLSLHDRALGLKAAGYLVIPGEPVLSGLTTLWPAFCGAFFFTLTTGAGLSFLGFAAAWVYRFSGRNKGVLAALLVMWIALIVAANFDGWNAAAASAFVLIPAIVFFLCRRWMPADRVRGDNLGRIVHILAILAVAAAWAPRLDGNVFINIRDYLLLENPAGKAVNAFYYRYTLYPAELFKSLDQKLQKAVCMDGISDPVIFAKLSDRLIDYESLPVQDSAVCDLALKQDGKQLLFSGPDRTLARVEADAFLFEPASVLHEISGKMDVHRFFRLFTFVSLVTAFPLSLYVLVHAVFGMLFGIFRQSAAYRSVLASLVCLAIGIGAVVPLYAGGSGPLSMADIRNHLASGDWRQQRIGLKELSTKGIDPLRFPEFDPEWMKSPHVAVRYWLAQSLGNSRRPEAFQMLLQIVDDPHPNVACMAFHGLGRSRNPRAVDLILSRLPEIRHWYVQWYAYKSLKRLGWRQKLSDSAFGR